MKKSVLSAAMLLALGVSGAANAVQMHGVIEGTLTSFSDNGADKAWGVLLPGAPLPDAVHIDFWFDSSVIASYNDGKISQQYTAHNDPAVKVSATYNGVPKRISSEYVWVFRDDRMGVDAREDLLDISVAEFSGTSPKINTLQLHAAFSDGSLPVLKEVMLGHSLSLDTFSKPDLAKSFFTYKGEFGGKTYDSKLGFMPTSFAIAPVPEPETWAMMLLGLGVVGYAARRRAAR